MKRKSWHLDRRTVLKGAGGFALALPFLDAMALGKNGVSAAAKKRFCALYFPFGVTVTPKGHRDERWTWHPKVEKNGSYTFREIMKPLNSLKNRVTVVDGLHHMREKGGHPTGDGFLTGTPGGKTISLDQIVAEKYGEKTRYSSLTLGLDGGVGAQYRSNTLSYLRDGTPIPTQTKLRTIFDSMFSKAAQDKMVAELKRNSSILDRVLENSKDLNGKLGKRDQAKLDEYMSSVRQLEKKIQKQEAWMKSDLPEVDTSKMSIDVTVKEKPEEYLQCMFELIYLAFQTDMTRSVSFQIGNQDNAGVTNFMTKGLGMGDSQHGMSHGMNKDDGAAKYGKYLQYLTGLYGKFLQRMKDTTEGAGSLLDNTLTLYGSSNGNPTHNSKNLPIIIAGGEAMGFKQGQYLQCDSNVPLSNLYLTMLNGLGAPQVRFSESTGRISKILKR